jgi:hypothetical protein
MLLESRLYAAFLTSISEPRDRENRVLVSSLVASSPLETLNGALHRSSAARFRGVLEHNTAHSVTIRLHNLTASLRNIRIISSIICGRFLILRQSKQISK